MRLFPVVLLALLAGTMFAAGCNGVLASDAMTTRLQAEAARAKVVLDDPVLTVSEAKGYITVGSGALADYYVQATTNPFAYSFTDGKGLLLSARFYRIVRSGSILAVAARDQAAKAVETKDDPQLKRIAVALARIIYKIELARQGEDE